MTSERTCILDGAKCHYTGSTGVCCNHICVQYMDEEFGRCITQGQDYFDSSPSDSLASSSFQIPDSCMPQLDDLGCASSDNNRFCCNHTYCHFLDQIVSVCRESRSNPKSFEGTEGSGFSWVIPTAIAVPLIAIILIAFGVLYRKLKRLKKVLSQAEEREFFYENPEAAKLNAYAHENPDYLPYDKNKWEISDSAFKIDWSCLLGQGAYGLVLKANVRDQVVAVKTVKLAALENSSYHVRSLLSEIKTLQYIGTYDNIVNMVGSNTSNLQNGKVFLFLEYCPLGSLEKYLRDNKSKSRSESWRKSSNPLKSETEYMEMEETDSYLSISDLLNWCIQITMAMRHLEQKKVIHADLAARNVLLMRKDCAKLTDFGLSRRLYEYTSYVKKHQEPLPWRHMALEALKQLSFSHKSDVWSLGILFWEILSFGDVPYPGMGWTGEFISQVEKKNMRPLKPDIATEKMYDIMLDCWKANPEERPRFEEIQRRIWKCKEAQDIISTD